MSAIGICGFGLDLNTFEDENNIFLTKCREIFNVNFATSSVFFSKVVMPLNCESLAQVLLRVKFRAQTLQ